MKKWRIDYAYRKDGEYKEDSLFVSADYIYGALSEAKAVINSKAFEENWDATMIWNAAIMAEADEEVF